MHASASLPERQGIGRNTGRHSQNGVTRTRSPNARAARALPRTFLLSLLVIMESWPLAVQACAVRAVRSPFPFVPLACSAVHLLPRVPLPIPELCDAP